MERGFLLDVLVEDLLVELKPGGEALAVGVLEAKEPDLSQSNGFHNLKIKINVLISAR